MKKCIGCGILLQSNNKNQDGYTEKEENIYCERCFQIMHYGKYKEASFNNNDYQKIIDNIDEKELIIYVTDFLYLDLPKIKNPKNSIIVITKKDLLPQNIKSEKIIQYLKLEYPTIKDVLFISSKKEEGMDDLFHYIKEKKKAYVVGMTNSGKSTLINTIRRKYSNQKEKNDITVSMYPSTTLKEISISFNDFTLIDTPGLIDEKDITPELTKEELKEITIKKEIKPRTYQIKEKGSIVIEKYLRIDYIAKNKASLVFFTSANLKIRFASLDSNLYKDYNSNNYHLEGKKNIIIKGLGVIQSTGELDITIYTKWNKKPEIKETLYKNYQIWYFIKEGWRWS